MVVEAGTLQIRNCFVLPRLIHSRDWDLMFILNRIESLDANYLTHLYDIQGLMHPLFVAKRIEGVWPGYHSSSSLWLSVPRELLAPSASLETPCG